MLNHVLTRGHTYHTHTHTYRNCTSTPMHTHVPLMHTCVIHLTQCTCAHTCTPHTCVGAYAHSHAHACPHAHARTSHSDWAVLGRLAALRHEESGTRGATVALDGGAGGALPPRAPGGSGRRCPGAMQGPMLSSRHGSSCPEWVGGQWPGTAWAGPAPVGCLDVMLGLRPAPWAPGPVAWPHHHQAGCCPLPFWPNISLLCPCAIVSHRLTLGHLGGRRGRGTGATCPHQRPQPPAQQHRPSRSGSPCCEGCSRGLGGLQSPRLSPELPPARQHMCLQCVNLLTRLSLTRLSPPLAVDLRGEHGRRSSSLLPPHSGDTIYQVPIRCSWKEVGAETFLDAF